MFAEANRSAQNNKATYFLYVNGILSNMFSPLMFIAHCVSTNLFNKTYLFIILNVIHIHLAFSFGMYIKLFGHANGKYT